jgi:low temperature requirement protein LtrA
MSEAGTVTTGDTADDQRHASWLELFFDLIVPAGVAQVAHRLREQPTPADGAACVAMFYAVWSVWTAFSTYANVAADKTRTRALFGAMLGIGVMVAAIPGALPELLPSDTASAADRIRTFVIWVPTRGAS